MIRTRAISKKELLKALDTTVRSNFDTVAVELTLGDGIFSAEKKIIVLTIEVEVKDE